MDNFLSAIGFGSGLSTLLAIVAAVASFAFLIKMLRPVCRMSIKLLRWVTSFFTPLLFLLGRYSQVFFDELPIFKKLPPISEWVSDSIMKHADSINFDRREMAEEYWPSDKHPALYQVARRGLKREPYDDGWLVGGYNMGLLIRNYYTRDLHVNSIKSGLIASRPVAVGFFIVATVIALVSSGTIDYSSFFERVYCSKLATTLPGPASTSEYCAHVMGRYELSVAQVSSTNDVLENWGEYSVVRDKSFGEYVADAGSFVLAVCKAIVALIWTIILIAVASVLVYVFSASILIPSIVSSALNGRTKMLRTPTNDAEKRWDIREYDVMLSWARQNDAINTDKSVCDRLGTDLITVGYDNGTFSNRGAIGGYMRGDEVNIDLESLLSNIAVFGAIGTGKTTAVAKKLFRQIAAIVNSSGKRFGALCLDAKGVLYEDLKRIAESIGRGSDVVLIGFDDDMAGLDPLANLKPSDLSSVMRSVMDMAGEASDPVWNSNAEIVIKNAASLVYAWSRVLNNEDGTCTKTDYNLRNIYEMMTDKSSLNNVLKTFKDIHLDNSLFDEEFDQLGQLRAAIHYLQNEWLTKDEKLKGSIMTSVNVVFEPIFSSPELSNKFSAINDDVQDIEQAFNGKLFMLSLSTVEHGTAAILFLALIKASFYRAASVREIKIGSKKCQESPVLVMIDEAQDIITTGISAIADSTFYARSRSAGICGVFLSQGVSSYILRMGDAATNSMLQNFRNVIILQNEDKATHELAIFLVGKARRAMSFQVKTAESLEYLSNIHSYDFLNYSRAFDVAEDAKNIVSEATIGNIFKNGVETNHHTENISDLFSPDYRFMPGPSTNIFSAMGGGQQSNPDSQINYMKEANWRAEDKEREFLSSGNEELPLLDSTDIHDFGRSSMFVFVVRAGLTRAAIVNTEHDFT